MGENIDGRRSLFVSSVSLRHGSRTREKTMSGAAAGREDAEAAGIDQMAVDL